MSLTIRRMAYANGLAVAGVSAPPNALSVRITAESAHLLKEYIKISLAMGGPMVRQTIFPCEDCLILLANASASVSSLLITLGKAPRLRVPVSGSKALPVI